MADEEREAQGEGDESMIDTDVKSQEKEAVARLAEQFEELRGPCFNPYRSSIHPKCEGSKTSEKREQCQVCGGYYKGHHTNSKLHDGKCRCRGSGWLPVSPAEALYWLMGQGFIWLFFPRANGECRAVRKGIDGEGPTPLLALAAAIEAAE